MNAIKPYIFYTVDTPTGLACYRDNRGNVQKGSVALGMGPDGIDVSCNAPDGWMNSELGFMRNAWNYGMNRSFSVPQKLVDDAAYIARYMINMGRGIEVPLTMLIFQYNDNPQPGEPTYKLYYKGQIDVPNHEDQAGEGLQVNFMEGGFQQLLKAYQNTIFEIPCDGSIPENIKVLLDGMLVQDTLNYSITPFTTTISGVSPLASVFIDNEGDNYGIIHNDPTFDPLQEAPSPSTYFQVSPNWMMNSAAKITAHVKGTITVASKDNTVIGLEVFLATNKSTPIGGTSNTSNTSSLIPTGGQLAGSGIYAVQGATTIPFEGSYEIGRNEPLFIMYNGEFGPGHGLQFLGGSYEVTFASAAIESTAWAVTWYDLFRLLIQNINRVASTNGQLFNFGFDSTLLKNNLNLVITSGDALRASGDANYKKFYNAIQTNPSYPNINLYYSYGPVIKTSLQDCFDSVNAVLNTSMSTQVLKGEGETIFVESKGYVFDASVTNLDSGEVTDFRCKPAIDLYFTILKVGYDPQQYDQKAGKYDWATLAEWQTPIKSIPSKTFEIKSKYLTTPFLIERLRSNIDATSTTRNSSDNSVFIINTDPTTVVADHEDASFLSANVFPANPDTAGNTNMKMTVNENLQAITLSNISGNYFSYSSDPAIFLFNQASLSGASKTLTLLITGNLLGLAANALLGTPADSTTIKLWYNGAVLNGFTITATGASTPININFPVTMPFSYKDSLYISCSTSIMGTASDLNVQLTVTDGGSPAYLSATGSGITVDPGTPFQLLALPVVAARLDGHSLPVMSWGFQWFMFNSLVRESNFNVEMDIAGFIRGGTSNTGEWNVYLNGQVVHSHTWPSTAAVSALGDNFSFNRDFVQGDILFQVGTATNTSVWFTNVNLHFVATQIFARELLRVQYQAISGIPLLLGNDPATGIPITIGAGAPYNLEDLTPKDMLLAWGNYLRSIFFDQIPGQLQFSMISKNEFLSRTYQGRTITEKANVDIGSLPPILFYPRYITYKCRVQDTFAAALTGAANGHVQSTYNAIPWYGFPMELKQQTALNGMQDWKLLASPKSDLTQLLNLDITGLNFLNMKNNSIFCSRLSPVQFVPLGQILSSKYHTRAADLYWFSEQITNWINQNNYWQPWQNDDPCNLQFITRDLTSVSVKLYQCGPRLISTTNATEVFNPAVDTSNGYHLWEVSMDLSLLAQGGYYIVVSAGSIPDTAQLISEGLDVRPDWPKTILFEYTHSAAKESMIFGTGTTFAMRIRGFFDNTAKQKFKATFYTDTRQQVKAQKSYRYRTYELWCGLDDGIPDYVHDKIAGILLCDGCENEGIGFSIDVDAEWEPARQVGNPKSFQKIEIRETLRLDGVSATAAGADTDASMMASIDAAVFAPNAGNTGGQDQDIISVTVTP